ncbi:MAG: SRPBCC family protein [Bdellovibrionaceae bacterium]|nr:SRPBCC family protein [Bdellovibrionales bacterium]MCB9255197.1 SRPBCC family protein [Pseudobdellovibrionaceae bacterium]
MAKKIGIALGVLLGIFLIYVAFKSPKYEFNREVKIEANAAEIFPWINNSQKMNVWMPWKEVDPKMVMSFDGPEEGVGAKSSWTSDGQMGEGSSTIIESVPNQKTVFLLEYTKPQAMTQNASIEILPDGNASVVRWSVWGENGFIGRLFCSLVDVSKHINGSFDAGLNKLKQQVETSKPKQ